jgi:hypothetical protein
MPVNRLYDTWFRRIRQLYPDWKLTRVRNVAWFVNGLYAGRSVQLHHIASHIPGSAKLVSQTRRLSRFLDHSHLRVRAAYAPVARVILQQFAQTRREMVLIVDGTKVSAHHRLLMVAVPYRRRALPIAWTWVPHAKGYSKAYQQRALLAYVRTLLPPQCPVVVLGDSEFGAIEVLRQLDQWGWHYAIREKPQELARTPGHSTPQALRQLCPGRGECRWLPKAWFTKQEYRTSLLLYWQSDQPEPWLLATNLSQPLAVLRAYRQRMPIEQLFGDLKGHGVDLESTHLCHIARLSRLTFMVALLYLWLVHLGRRTVLYGQRHWVDRNERRDLSLFQIGWRIVQRCLTNGLDPPRVPLLLKLSGD